MKDAAAVVLFPPPPPLFFFFFLSPSSFVFAFFSLFFVVVCAKLVQLCQDCMLLVFRSHQSEGMGVEARGGGGGGGGGGQGPSAVGADGMRAVDRKVFSFDPITHTDDWDDDD